MASSFFNLGPSNYGRRLFASRVLGNPDGLPDPPYYLALFSNNADPDSGPTPLELTNSGRQPYQPIAPTLIPDGGTYSFFASGWYKVQNSLQVFFGFTATQTIAGVALMDSATPGTGNIIAWSNLSVSQVVTSADVAVIPQYHCQIYTRRGFYLDAPAPGLITYYGNSIGLPSGNPAPALDLHMALFIDPTLGLGGPSPVDPDAYPQPPFPTPAELSDPGYARQRCHISHVGNAVDVYSDGLFACPITGELTVFGPFTADQHVGGFALMSAATGGVAVAIWDDPYFAKAGGGAMIDGRSGWLFEA